MIGLAFAAALVYGVDWRRLAILAVGLVAPLPALLVVGLHWWKSRPDRSMRATWFCDAVATEIRAGATLRWAVAEAAFVVEADHLAALCREAAPMPDIAAAARAAFPEIGTELGALLARGESLGVRPAALFEEMADLALAQVVVAQEVASAAAPGKAAGAVLLSVPALALTGVMMRGGLDPYLADPAQRAAVLLGAGLTAAGVLGAVLILRGSR